MFGITGHDWGQGLPRTTVKHLAAAGIAAEHVADLGMSEVDDDVILDAAVQRNAAVVTFDADFHQALAVYSSRHQREHEQLLI